jgi:hypothetical protein
MMHLTSPSLRGCRCCLNEGGQALENEGAFHADGISRITKIIKSRRDGEANALANIGMLCISGLPLRSFMRILPDLVRAAFPVDTVGFFWSAPNGDMIDAYVEEPHFLSAEVAINTCLTSG